ncbi:MAG: stage II sporulation protein D [Peptococcaceae bacterium]|jgi:stage II sporulation protein D|nr:stage II sporulation protein D [Peptococcaceae bacterium]MDH7526070.1 stage II sporulation protein D [Peptococcaceae bacterium]
MRVSLWPARRKKRLLVTYLAVAFLLLIVLPCLVFLFLAEDEKLRVEGDAIKINLLLHGSNSVITLGLEEYVAGVVAAEMPASFDLEALKAQAVAARTYAVKRLQVPDPRVKNINAQADLSSDPQINQAWISGEEMKRRWGAWDFPAYKQKILRAVTETKGKVITYEGQVIDPLYHASCGGFGTENSEDVWKYKVPYLRRVPCGNHPEGDREAVYVFKTSELNRLLGTELKALPVGKFSVNGGGIAVKEKTASGRIKTFLFAGKTISGAELRSRLGLPSTHLEWRVEGDLIKFTTRGNGHGVGMCQYGAGSLAREGKSYSEILAYYYKGVRLASLK